MHNIETARRNYNLYGAAGSTFGVSVTSYSNGGHSLTFFGELESDYWPGLIDLLNKVLSEDNLVVSELERSRK